MKNLIITEEERKNILNLHGEKNANLKVVNNIFEEYDKILSMMGVNSKTHKLVLEGSGIYSSILDLPYFKNLSKYFEASTGVGKQLDELSKTLESAGIKNETDLLNAARTFFKENESNIKLKNAKDDIELVEVFLKTKYPNSLIELTDSLLVQAKKTVDFNIGAAINRVRNLGNLTTSNIDSLDGAAKNLDIDDLTEDSAEMIVKQLEESKTIANEQSIEYGKLLNTKKTELNQSKDSLKMANDELINKKKLKAETTNREVKELLERRIAELEDEIATFNTKVTRLNDEILGATTRKQQWDELSELLNKKKSMYDDYLISTKSVEGDLPKDFIVVDGTRYDMSNLNTVQKFYWFKLNKNLMSSMQDFTYSVSTIIKAAFIKQNLTTVLYENLALMRNMINDVNLANNADELDGIAKKILNDLKNIAGRITPSKDFSVKDLLKEGLGFGAGKDDITKAWDLLNRSLENVTPGEKQQILELIKKQYLTSGGASTNELGTFAGWVNWSRDIGSILQDFKKTKTASEATEIIEKSVGGKIGKDDFVGNILDSLHMLYIGKIRESWQQYLVAFIGKAIQFSITGIPGGIKYLTTPLLKYGVSWKGFAYLGFRVYIGKVLSSAGFGALALIFKGVGFGIFEATGVWKDYTDKNWDPFKDEMWIYYKENLIEQLKSVPNPIAYDIGWEEESKRVGGNYNAKLSIFRSHFLEFVMEFDNSMKSVNGEETAAQVQQRNVENLNKFSQEFVNEKTQQAYENATPEEKNTMQMKTRYDNYRDGIVSTNGPSFYGLSLEEAKKIQERLYFRPIGYTKTIPQFNNKEEKLSFSANINDILGQTWLCSKKVQIDNTGNQKCNGNSWRFGQYDIDFLLNDENFKKGNVENNPLKDKLIYVKSNSNERYSSSPSVGNNNQNVGPIKDLLPKLN